MEKIQLNIIALSHSVTQSHNYAVVLAEEQGNRRLPIVIGGFEAQAIAVAMEDMKPSRPLTHDLFKNTLDTFGVEVQEVIISNLLDGVFHAKIVCELNGEIYEIDARTSDSIAMAVRCECPIYTYEFIMEAAGVVVEEGEDDPDETKEPGAKPKPSRRKSTKKKAFNEMPLKELIAMLDTVISNEDYEQAARIRDEINRRKSAED